MSLKVYELLKGAPSPPRGEFTLFVGNYENTRDLLNPEWMTVLHVGEPIEQESNQSRAAGEK